MHRFSLLMVLCAITAAGPYSSAGQGMQATDTLGDVFPLAIGNQWTFGYFYDFEDVGQVLNHLCDTGYVELHVVGRSQTADSTRWIVQEIGTHWIQYNEGGFGGPTVETDTFEIVERNLGHHRLYRTGELVGARRSVVPFLPTFADTASVYRYAPVDSTGTTTFESREYPAGTVITFTFRQGVGLTAVHMSDGCLCIPWFWTDHTLRGFTVTGVADPPGEGRARLYRLDQNYPNPFNPSTTISFSLPSGSFVSLKVFDMMGREVATLVSGEMQEGQYSRLWDASGLASGVYFYRLQAGSFTETRKLVLFK